MTSIQIILRMKWISAVKVARVKGWVGQAGDLSNTSPTLVGGGGNCHASPKRLQYLQDTNAFYNFYMGFIFL